MRRRGWLLLLLGLGACDGTSRTNLRWSVRFANPETAARASQVDVSIVTGSCSSEDVIYESSATREARAEGPPNLTKGQYALRGRALTDGCLLVASGCIQVSLPAAGQSVELVLDDVTESLVCDGACAEQCDNGADGGTDGSMDAGPIDTGHIDAGHIDGGPMDAGGTAGLPCDALKGPNGRCYRIEASPRSFADAETACVAWGGHLVSFNDADEELWVNEQVAVLADAGIAPDFWIGFKDGVTEGQWVWTDNSTLPSVVTSFTNDLGKIQYKTATDTPYAHWGPNLQTVGNGQPNNGAGPKDVPPPEGQDCAASKGSKLSGPGGITPRPEWDDRSCSDPYVSVCERP